MKISYFCALGLVITGLATATSAQENWAGAYAGISIDALRAKTDVAASPVHRYKEDSAQFGLFAGYNFVRGPGIGNSRFVWGPEVSLTAVSTGGTRSDAALGASQFDGGFLFVPRVRAGYATERALFYGIAGRSFTDAMARPAGASGTDVTVAPAFGLGAEFAMGDGWRTKVEALHHRFDGPDFDFGGTTTSPDTSVTQITLGLSRKF